MAGNHLLVSAGQVAFGEVNRVGKLDHLSQEVGTRSEALNDAGDLTASGAGAPEVIGGRSFARGFMVFKYSDFSRLLCGWVAAGRPWLLFLLHTG